MSIVYFIILIGVLIFVHEFGHFLFAKIFDVKVERFSIGFGPAIFKYQHGETEYAVCWLPLGGYVKMLGFEMSEVEQIPEEERDRALMLKPIWQRSLITLAGPVFNLILPVVIYFFATMGQATAPPSIIGEVFPETPAAEAGLMPGDEIVEINGKKVRYWHELTDRISDAYDRELELVYERDGERHTIEISPEKHTSTDFMGLRSRTYGMLGIHLQPHGPTVGILGDDSPAAEAGLETFDRIALIDGEPIRRFDEIESRVRRSDGEPLEMSVLRRQPLDAEFGRFYAQDLEKVVVEPEETDEGYDIGIEPVEMFVAKVDDDSPAAEADLEYGDKIVALDGRRYSNWKALNNRITDEANEEIVAQQNDDVDQVDVDLEYELTYRRNGEEFTETLRPEVRRYTGQGDQESYRVDIGWGHLSDRIDPEQVAFPFFPRVAYSATTSVERTVEFCDMVVKAFVRMAQGRLDTKNLGGPIMIGELAAEAGKAGWEPFLQMMALISINLAVINLLPIPVLDGGHLVLYALEGIKRGPLSYRTRQIAAYIGLVIILFLMVFAFKNDIERNWDHIVEWLE